MKLAGFADEAAPDIEAQVRVLKELGWNSIELRTVNGVSAHDLDDAAFDRVRRELDSHDISVCCLGSSIANWGQSVYAPFRETQAAVKRAVRRMAQLETPLVRIMSYKVEENDQGRACEDQHEAERFSRLRDICSTFLDSGMTPVHENCHTYGGMSWEHTLKLIEEVPGLKLVYDTGNPELTHDFRTEFPYERQDAWEFYQHVKEHIVHVHIKDAVYDPEKKQEIYHFPGEGRGAVLRTVADLMMRGYNGVFSIEPHMAMVFHDASVTSDDQTRFTNFVEYGRRTEALLREAQQLASGGEK